LDLVLWHRFGSLRRWCFTDFLCKITTLSATTISDIWQSSIAGEQTVILSLGLSLCSICSRVTFMFIFVETMKPWLQFTTRVGGDSAFYIGFPMQVI
jgi:hypothetical protein